MIPQAFLNGMRAATPAGGMGDVRPHAMRSMDQNQTQSGNPGLSYNMPQFSQRDQQMAAMQTQGGADGFLANSNLPQYQPQQYQAPMMRGPMDALSQYRAAEAQRVLPVNGGMQGYAKPMLRFNQPNPQPQVGTMPVQQPGQGFYRRPMVTNLNRGRFGGNRILQQ